jgi:peptidoglycan/LPS O-acetylase OafA/YrhL
LFHAGVELFDGGFVGVDVFFVISGYLITSIILREIDEGKFSLTNFYERRARRILPALFFVILVTTIFGLLILSPSQLENYSDSALATSTYWSNIYFWRNINYFGGSSELAPLLHTWSLSIEEQYYVIYPFFLLLFWRLGKRNILAILTVAFVISLATSQWATSSYPHASFYLLLTRGWEILAGAFIAFYLQNRRRKRDANAARQLASMAGLGLITYSVFAFGPGTPFPGAYTLVPTIGTALIVLFAVNGTLVNALL